MHRPSFVFASSRSLSFPVALLALATLSNAKQTSPDLPPELSVNEWNNIRATYETGRHAASPTENGFEARNPGQRWQLEFDSQGFLAEPDSRAWTWGLELASYGFATSEIQVGKSACASAEGGHITYQWNDSLEEWYVNDERGLEHGFTVRERPTEGEGPLTLRLRVRGSLSAEVQSDGQGVSFLDESGQLALNYSGLTVFDANGETLRAWFEQDSKELILLVDECDAQYPLTIDPIAQEAYLKASNTEAFDVFGRRVAISGDTLVVTAHEESSGAAGVNADESDNSMAFAGAAYVFVRNGSSWSQQAYLKASNPGANDKFGISAAISDDTIIIGASGERSDATGVDGDQQNDSLYGAGAAYVFVRTGTTWTQQAYLKASNTDGGQPLGDGFGASVSVSGNTIVVGALGEDSNATGVNGDQADESASRAGAAYVFVRAGAVWSQQAYLKASNAESVDFFGWSVAISNNLLVIGAPGEDSSATGVNGIESDSTAPGSGAAYVFVRSGSTWAQDAYLKASNTEGGDSFGETVAISDHTLIVGAKNERSNATGINGDESNNSLSGAGAAYVFARTESNWSQQAYLKASNTGFADRFGGAVTIDGNRIVVGAELEDSSATGIGGDQDNNETRAAGAAYLFTRTGSVWSQGAYIKASNTDEGDTFGSALALSGNALVVGAPFEGSASTGVNGNQFNEGAFVSGAAYAFDLDFGSIPSAGVDFCSGDGGDQAGCTNCPCGNNAIAGTKGGCLNSAAVSARLFATGDTSASLPSGDLSDLRFSLNGAPPLAFCILNSGDGVAPGNPMSMCFGLGSGVQAMQFDGLRCAIQNTRRHGGRSADANGAVGITGSPWGGEGNPPAGIAQAGGTFVAGQTRYFQVINRDDPLLGCMRGLNTSQAIEITFTP